MLRAYITGLFTPPEGTPVVSHRVSQYSNAEVDIKHNDQRTATVQVSLDDPASAVIEPYKKMLKVYYWDHLVFWGPITLTETRFGQNHIEVSASDIIRLQRHYLRRGDLDGVPYGLANTEMSEASDDKGAIPKDYRGLRMLRDAALNTAEQNTREVPDLGIINGTNNQVTNDQLIEVVRGDEVWNTWMQLMSHTGMGDFEIEPIDGTWGAYARLNTYVRQGTDLSQKVGFHYGSLGDNLSDFTWQRGSSFITHAHVLDRENKYRFTEANSETSEDAGIYVEWDATDYDVSRLSAAEAEAILRAYGEYRITSYSEPLDVYTLTCRPEPEVGYRYLDDYAVGDDVHVFARRGTKEVNESAMRIVGVSLKQSDAVGNTQPTLSVIPKALATPSTIPEDA